MEWWETTDEYNPGISIWRGKPILNEESDLEILVKEEMDFKEEKEESDLEILIKDEMAETVPQGSASIKVFLTPRGLGGGGICHRKSYTTHKVLILYSFRFQNSKTSGINYKSVSCARTSKSS